MTVSGGNDFRYKFMKLLNDSGLEVQKEWETPLPDFTQIIAKFIDLNSGRILTIEESGDFDFEFDYAVRRTGVDFEQYDLLLKFQNASSNLIMTLKIYEMWFVQKLSVDEIEIYLSALLSHSTVE